jgi:hypothetical protein
VSTRKRTFSGVHQHRIIDLLGCKFQTRANVFRFEELIILEDFGFRNCSRQQIEHIFDPKAIVANAGSSAALLRVKRDAIHVFHADIVAVLRFLLKEWF